jgi:hypothetical protein
MVVRVLITLLFCKHRVEIECPDTQLYRSAGPVKLFSFINKIVNMFKLGIGARSLNKPDTILLVHRERAAGCCIGITCLCICAEHLTIHSCLRHPVKLHITLLFHVALPLIIRHLPNQITWPNWCHIVQLTTILIINIVYETVRILPVPLTIELRRPQI